MNLAPPDVDVESLERATLDAVAPPEVLELDDWLLPFDHSTIGRAKSAVPKRHHSLKPQDVALIEECYTQRGMPTVLRVANVPALAPIHTAMRQLGYRATEPTLVQVGSVAQMRAACQHPPATVCNTPTPQWSSLYTAHGFDPIDGANRVNALSRSSTVIYAHVEDNGQTVAAGTASFSHGWCSIHGMRTLPTHQGRGLAGRILAGLADAAMHQGIAQVFLQVHADNPPALALYARSGFATAWVYHYWKKN